MAGPVWVGVEVQGGGSTTVSLVYGPTHTPCTRKAPATPLHAPHSLFHLEPPKSESPNPFFMCTGFLLASCEE